MNCGSPSWSRVWFWNEKTTPSTIGSATTSRISSQAGPVNDKVASAPRRRTLSGGLGPRLRVRFAVNSIPDTNHIEW